MFDESGAQWAVGGGVSQPSEENPHGLQIPSNQGGQPGDGSVPWMTEQIIAQYAPILTQTDNPHYYENNKMLFALFMERVHRISPL